MARKTRSPEEIERIRNNIIEESMKLILEKGFDNMSLRKLAERVGMSAANIYYYYASKDEIYLNIQIKGFRLLQSSLEDIRVSENDPLETLGRMIRAYLDFGFTNPDYYQIMLNSNTPRYLEYKSQNKAMEPVALEAKQMAVNAISVPLKAIDRISRETGSIPEQDIYFRAYQLWITLHGIVTLNNRNILRELDEIDSETLIQRMCRDLLRPFHPGADQGGT
ncbi:MAG: TetR/AcrR family transcriptional regulator [Desulfobacteraceae bacterium]|nr:TetR/AcrR family transcriptional regulator [Desulfobacteraceae bacterium]